LVAEDSAPVKTITARHSEPALSHEVKHELQSGLNIQGVPPRYSTATESHRRERGVQDGFDQFVVTRLDRLLRYATALTCDPHLAQDIVQDVLVRAQHRWSRIGSLNSPDLYVRKMVTNEYLSWRRRRAARDIASEHHTLDAIGQPTGDPAVRYAEREAMRARIAILPRKQRAAVVLRYYEDRTDAEIAEILGCTSGTVRSHLSRALGTLRAAAGSPMKEHA
jgi:RNA polymerase sigma-70 factor (sigma-E family)